MTRCTAVLGRLWDCSSKVTVAKAMVPSLLIWPAPAGVKGLATESTCGSVATCASMRWARDATAGERTVPEVAGSTIWSELPDAAGKSFCSKLSARADWVSGNWNLVEKSVPTALLAAADPTRATSHKTSTILRWREHHLAMTFTLAGLSSELPDGPDHGLLRSAEPSRPPFAGCLFSGAGGDRG